MDNELFEIENIEKKRGRSYKFICVIFGILDGIFICLFNNIFLLNFNNIKVFNVVKEYLCILCLIKRRELVIFGVLW